MKNFENFIKDNIDSLEGLPSNVSWSKESGWAKLNAKQSKSAGLGVLGFLSINKQATPWYYAVAASLTVTIASYFVVQNFVAIGNDANSQAGATIDSTMPIMSLQSDLSVAEKPLSYPHILTGIEKSTKNILGKSHAASKFEGTIQQRDVIKSITTAYLVPENKTIWNNENTVSLTKWALTPIPKRQLIFDVHGDGGLISDDFEAGVGVDLLLKVKNNHAFGVGAKSSYVFVPDDLKESTPADRSTASGLATFVTASYHKNISKNIEKPLWLALKGGYMVQNNTAVFNDNTVSIALEVNVNDKIKITPQIYLTNNLTKAMPGIKVGMTIGKLQKDISI